jgi:hypothetical protein
MKKGYFVSEEIVKELGEMYNYYTYISAKPEFSIRKSTRHHMKGLANSHKKIILLLTQQKQIETNE